MLLSWKLELGLLVCPWVHSAHPIGISQLAKSGSSESAHEICTINTIIIYIFRKDNPENALNKQTCLITLCLTRGWESNDAPSSIWLWAFPSRHWRDTLCHPLSENRQWTHPRRWSRHSHRLHHLCRPSASTCSTMRTCGRGGYRERSALEFRACPPNVAACGRLAASRSPPFAGRWGKRSPCLSTSR